MWQRKLAWRARNRGHRRNHQPSQSPGSRNMKDLWRNKYSWNEQWQKATEMEIKELEVLQLEVYQSINFCLISLVVSPWVIAGEQSPAVPSSFHARKTLCYFHCQRLARRQKVLHQWWAHTICPGGDHHKSQMMIWLQRHRAGWATQAGYNQRPQLNQQHFSPRKLWGL